MVNAVSYWGAHAGGTADGVDDDCAEVMTEAVGTETCNGNGSGSIAESIINPSYNTDQWYESGRFWQHLSNAGLIEGRYVGTTYGRNNYTESAGVNMPAEEAAGKNASWSVHNAYFDGNPDWFDVIPAVDIVVLAKHVMGSSSGVFTPADALAIDKKIDDGKPATGKVFPYPGTGIENPGCTVDRAIDTTYVISSDQLLCSLNFVLD